MSARSLGVCLTCAALTATLDLVAQQRPVDTFRSARDLLTIDAAVRDADGRPLKDLQPSDFVVRIDGEPRRVLAAQLFDSDADHITVGAPIPRFTRGLDASAGRIVVFAIDQDSIKSGSEKAAIETAARMVDSLSPADAVGVAPLPLGGIELTRDHARVADAIRRMTGTASNPGWQHVISWDEALAYERDNTVMISTVVARECADGSRTQAAMDVVPCPQALRQQAREMLSTGRGHAVAVLTRLTDLLDRLQTLHAPKHLVLVSGGLPFDIELLSRYQDLATKAAEAHVALSIVHLDQPSFDASNRANASLVSGRDYASGLGSIAASTGGEFFSAVGRATGVFDRIATGINFFYELGVESRPRDADGKTHKVEVTVNRPGAHVRAPAATAVTAAGGAQPSLADVLAEPTDLAELPIEVATYTMHSTDPSKVRLLIAATLSPPANRPPSAWGYVIFAGEKVVARKDITIDSAAEQPWSATASIELPIGRYRVRTAVIDAEGRAGTLDVPVTAGLRAAGSAQASELVVGVVAEGGIQPRARIRQGELALAMIELSSGESLTGTTGVLEVIRGGTAQIAFRHSLAVRTREQDARIVVAEAPMDLSALGPGIYTASAVLERAGAAFARVSRVFDILPGTVAASAPPPPPTGGAAARDSALDEVLQRVGDYVAGYGQQASLIIGVEHYDQRLLAPTGREMSQRLITAEFALVKTNDAMGWSGFRDVIEVDGRQVGHRKDRLQTLFKSTTPDAAEARRIADESARFNLGPVRRNFNDPTAALLFLTPSVQPRFAFTRKAESSVNGVNVWEVEFKEKTRPTLIRTSNGRDVPSEGRIWVIPSDGTVVRTLLTVSGFSGRSRSDIDVSYARDERLELWLPQAMKERHEAVIAESGRSAYGSTGTSEYTTVVLGTATYGDFKRFQTSIKIK